MIKERNPVILLPYDFTEVSIVAMKHACALAKLFGYSLTILNIYDRGTRKYMNVNNIKKKDIQQKISELSTEISQNNNIEVNYIFRSASIKRMCKFAEECRVSFMVLGIDEPRGNGSQILKVVSKSRIPVFVVQQNSEVNDYKNIMFPLDDFYASRQKVGWAARLALTTGAKIHIFSVNDANKSELYKQQKIVDQVEEFFQKHHVRFTTMLSKGGMKSFTKELLDYCSEQKCDVMVIMHRPNSFFGGLHPVDKGLIFNEARIPVMCVNISEVLITGGIS